MSFLDDWLKALRHLIRTVLCVLLDLLALVVLTCRSRSAVEAENLFLRKQLALFQERQIKPRQADDATRWLMTMVSRWFDWRNALIVVQPETLIRWHRKGFRLFWRWKSQPVGRPRIPKDLQALIRQMARENPCRPQQPRPESERGDISAINLSLLCYIEFWKLLILLHIKLQHGLCGPQWPEPIR